ncbi:protein-tyrosine phosphatase family protein [Chamaesiphon polymorphus]|uniref:Protein phosphatase n=1 Tax=Chamaesiphon polymorphus CCALA 037 TaxID=2107692 RepID=A0A2T1GEF9_9CYAN|nr:dual specificity protein phosphatase family protein [Chamaesiphon polymorphus]PSB55878.1 protein phosphatase [Chamaesiphon polymorphus CCALA 037]
MEQSAIQPIVENLWWVIPGKLAGVRKPTSAEIEELQKVGIGAIVSVMHDKSNLELYQQENIPYLWLPIQIASSPSRSQVAELIDFVDRHHRQGVGTAIHCTGGLHRTGTMLAAYLILNGSAYEDAMRTIETANSQALLELAQQVFLRSLAARDSKS